MTAPARTQRKPLMQSTSRAAFRDFDPTTVDGRIVAFIRERGGATTAEIVATLGIPHQTASAQIAHLKAPNRRVLHASDEKRPTPSGRAATVWKVGAGPSLAPYVRPNAITEQLELGVR